MNGSTAPVVLHVPLSSLSLSVRLHLLSFTADHVVAYAQAFYSNSTIRDMVWGLGVHWYTGGSFDNVQQVTEQWPEKGVMATEACACPVNVDSWEYGERYGHDILQDLNVGVQGWTDCQWQQTISHTQRHCTASSLINHKRCTE